MKMASFLMEDFIGNGVLKGLFPKLLEEGWDDVPTLKVMTSQDMDAINMTRRQKEALEIRSYLHERALMQYGDKLELSGKCLPELLDLSIESLISQFNMKRGHVARFKNRASSCLNSSPIHSMTKNIDPASQNPSIKKGSISTDNRTIDSIRSYKINETGLDRSPSEFQIKEGYSFKGIVAAGPADPRACGCVYPPTVIEDVAPYSAIENISIQKLTPEYKVGIERLVKTKTPPMKASDLWKHRPAIILCIRRPGCIMCRAEAHRLYSKKPIFDALGVQLFAVLHEHIESEVNDFWPRYWGGVVLFDQRMEFFKALGGGKLLKDKFLSGFVFNPRAISNYKRAKAMGIKQNFVGEGEIKGGLFVVGPGKSGIAYEFIERNFGDWAPLPEVTAICTQLKNSIASQQDSIIECDWKKKRPSSSSNEINTE